MTAHDFSLQGLTRAVTFDSAVLCSAALHRRVENVLALEKFHALFLICFNNKIHCCQFGEIQLTGLHYSFAFANACLLDGCGTRCLPRDDGETDGDADTVKQRALFRCQTLPTGSMYQKAVRGWPPPLGANRGKLSSLPPVNAGAAINHTRKTGKT